MYQNSNFAPDAQGNERKEIIPRSKDESLMSLSFSRSLGVKSEF